MQPVEPHQQEVEYWVARDGCEQHVRLIGGPEEGPDVIPCPALIAPGAGVVHVALELDELEVAALVEVVAREEPRRVTAINDQGDNTAIATCGTCHPPADDTPEREAMDRFATFLRIIGDAPRDDEGRYLVNPRTLAYARGEDVDPMGCTGVSASWCPRHGDCTCPRDDETGEWVDGCSGDGCPLHDPASEHPWPDEAELPSGMTEDEHDA